MGRPQRPAHVVFLRKIWNFRKKCVYLQRTIILVMEQRTLLNEAQLGILRLLSRMKTVEQVNELRQIISNYYAQKATEEMDRLWDSGAWNEEKNNRILKEHLRTPYRHAK